MRFNESVIQRELRTRRSDSLPFVDQRSIKGAVRLVINSMARISSGAEVMFPFDLSEKEQEIIKERLTRHHYSLSSRVVFFSGARLNEGVGTLIAVDKM